MRVSPPRVFADVARAPRPALDMPEADAHRQAGFVLGDEIQLVLDALGFEGSIAAELSGARYRKPPIAAVLAFSSRAWSTRLEALHAAETGNYAAAFPLLRSAADYVAAVRSMLGASAEEWSEWATSGGIARAPAQHALQYELHPFRSAEELARNESLGRIYRLTSALALPHFGSTLLLTGNASDGERLAVTFGDRDFHLGLAEMILGLLEELSREQLGALLEESELFSLKGLAADADKLLERIDSALARRDRCRLEFTEIDGRERISVDGFRRAAGGAAARIIL